MCIYIYIYIMSLSRTETIELLKNGEAVVHDKGN